MDIRTVQERLQMYLNRPTVLTIGVFDGVHRGHQHLIDTVRERAAALGCLSGVVTLYPHPQQVLFPGHPLGYITTLEERLRLLRAQQVDWVAVLRFDQELAQARAADFVAALRNCVPFPEIWVGPDFALGRGREGTLARLQEWGEEQGFRAATVTPLLVAGQVANSTSVRQLLAGGDVEQAAGLLGRFPTLSGPVVTGAQRGRRLGFPTANIETDPEVLVPANGVYAAYAHWSGRSAPAVVSIGNRPTFDNGARSIEAFLLDTSEDLYGQQMTLEFRQRLRGEVRFPGPEALIAQIQEDVRQARGLLGWAPARAASRAPGTLQPD